MAENVSAQVAIDRLITGNKRFVAGSLKNGLKGPGRRPDLTGGQKPFAIILACADSRVAPELIFDQTLGDLFVIRVAGNVNGTEVLASIEYAVAALGVRLVVVTGHQSCGAVGAAVKGGRVTDHISRLVHAIEPSVIEARQKDGDVVENAIRINAQRTARILVESSATLTQEVAEGGLQVLPGYYSLETGVVEIGDL